MPYSEPPKKSFRELEEESKRLQRAADDLKERARKLDEEMRRLKESQIGGVSPKNS